VPFNVPTVTTDDISFGPAILIAGVAGTTPSANIGSITEDGISIEITSEKRSISQGNPRTPVFAFSQAQGVMVKVTGIEWDYENFARGLGAGVTTSSASEETFAFGGDPILTEMALHIQHYMAVSGNTLNVYIWKAVSEGGLTLPLGQDEHSFEYSLMALRSDTDWGGTSLPGAEQLMKIVREL
jgi:hypothetical protein